MNEVIHKFLLSGYIFMPEMHLKQPGFTYSACKPFTKNKESIQKFNETGHTKYIYKNEFDKAYMAYGAFKDLSKRTASDKVLRDKAFNITKNSKYDGYQRGFASMVYKFKKSASLPDKSAAGCGTKNEITQYQQLAEELLNN